MRWSDWNDLAHETAIALVLHWRRTAFIVGGSAIGVALYLALSGLSLAGASAVASSLESAGGAVVVARPAGGAADIDLFERYADGGPPAVPGASTTELVSLGSVVLVSNALSTGSLSAGHEALLVTSSENFFGSGQSWPLFEKEVVISSSLAGRLGVSDLAPPFGIIVKGIPVTVINIVGIPEALGTSADVVISRSDSTLLTQGKVTGYRLVSIADGNRVQDVASALPYVISPSQPERVAVLTSLPSAKLQSAIAQQTSSWMSVVAWLGVLVAGCSVGLPLIMSVAERRPEIGLRRAIGYPEIAINLQFTFAGLLASFSGGVLGVGIGALAQVIISSLNRWPMRVDPLQSILMLTMSSVIGLVAGAASAAVAARVSPVDSLRPGL